MSDSAGADWLDIAQQLVPLPSNSLLWGVALLGAVLLSAVVLRSKYQSVLPVLAFVLTASWCGFYLIGLAKPVVHVRALMPILMLSVLFVGIAFGQLLEARERTARWLSLAAFTITLSMICMSDLALLSEPERAASQHKMGKALLKKMRSGDSVWAPRSGNAFALCWELVGPGAVNDPTARKACTLPNGGAIYSGSRRARELQAPFWIVRFQKEREPRTFKSERLGKWEREGSLRYSRVTAKRVKKD